MRDVDKRVLAELKGHLDRAEDWALPDELAKNDKGFSLIESVRSAVRMFRLGLALARWDDLSSDRPQLSEEAEGWKMMENQKLIDAMKALAECFPEGAYSLAVTVGTHDIKVNVILPDGLGGWHGESELAHPEIAVADLFTNMGCAAGRIMLRAEALRSAYNAFGSGE